MTSQRRVLILGFGTLLAIGAASILLDVKSRQDAARVELTLRILQKTSDLRLLLRQTESASRGYALSGQPHFVEEVEDAKANIRPALAELLEDEKDNPTQRERLRIITDLVRRRLSVSDDLIRLYKASDQAGMTALIAKGQGRIAMAGLLQQLEAFVDEERHLLATRTETTRSSRRLLLTIDLAGVAFLLLVAAYAIRRAYASSHTLRTLLRRTKAEKTTLVAKTLTHEGNLVAVGQELEHFSRVLENTFESMAEGVLVVQPDGTIVRSNQAVGRYLGTRPGKTFGEMVVENRFYEADGRSRIPDEELPIARALRGISFDRREVVVRPTDGRKSFRLMVSGRPLRTPNGDISGAAMIYDDYTSSHESEQQLQQAQKLDAIGKLTGGVAHDFNNMLTIITGSIEALLEQIKDRPFAAEMATLISGATDRCTELIQHLLAFARKQPLRPRDVDINNTVIDIAKLLRPTLGAPIEIRTILEQSTLIAHIDSAQLANSLVNMAINARDAMPNGGKLLLETQKVWLDDSYVGPYPGIEPGAYILVAITDTGAGMPAEVRERAFEPFFTTKDVGKGSGLGLSMVNGFVRQSGGHVHIYSEEGRGTTIRLYLPPAVALTQTGVVAETHVPRGSETILVVEDDPLVRSFVLSQLKSLGYKTLTASRGTEALAIVDSGGPFDLVFTDMIMPGGMSGKELATEIARRRPATKVLYTSGYTDNAIVEHGHLDAGTLLLSKPYRRSELAQMIRRALTEQPSFIRAALTEL